MKRRDFIKNSIQVTTIPILLGGFSLRSFGNPLFLQALSSASSQDRILILIQLHGGNDGLNTVIPLADYGNYAAARGAIAIPETDAEINELINGETSLHPAMTGLKGMYADDKLGIIQGVGYSNQNFSHFRSTDIWLSGVDSAYSGTGWMGRYFDEKYPTPPATYPLAVSIGAGIASPAFLGASQNMGMTIKDPNALNFGIGAIDTAPDSLAGCELNYIRGVGLQTQGYVTAIEDAYNSGSNYSGAGYPSSNTLADQLKIVARLIQGGLETKVYMVGIGSFDTHQNQLGAHNSLLGKLSSAVTAFQKDIEHWSLQDRIVGMTFSEFGRRIPANGTGTDHGEAAPLFLFGTGIKKGILGQNPRIVDENNTMLQNVELQFDFRSIYATVLRNWFCINNSVVNDLLAKTFSETAEADGSYSKTNFYSNLPLFDTSVVCPPPGSRVAGNREKANSAPEVREKNYPNPFDCYTTIPYESDGGHIDIRVYDTTGREIEVLVNGQIEQGKHQIRFDATGLPTGMYYYKISSSRGVDTYSMIVE